MVYSPSTTKKPTKREERDTLTLLDDYFQQALDDPSWREARDEMIQCFDYKENRQWTKDELRELASRGQPPTVNNQVKVTIDRIVGQFVQVRSKTTYKPRNQPDEELANTMSDIYTYIRQLSGLEFEERDVMEDGATGGFGVFEVCIEDGDEVLVKAEDCFNIFPDPKSRRFDWNQDARYVCRAKWVDREYALDLYPDKKKEIKGIFDAGNSDLSNVDALKGESYIDYNRDRIRLVEVQYKKTVNAETYVFSDGKVMDGDEVDDDLLKMVPPGVTYTTKTERKEHICIGVFSAGILFEHGVSERKRFSFIPYFVNRKKNGAPYSPITTAIPIQDAINKRQSKSLYLLTVNQATYEEGAIKDKAELQQNMDRPNGQIVVEDGYFDKFRMDKNLELAMSQNQMFLQDKQDFRNVTGVNPDAMGEKSEVRSGVGIQRKVAMTGLIVAPIFDNFRRAREALAKTIHDAVRVAYTDEKILNITDNPKSTRVVALDKNKLDAVKQATYDIIISEEEDYDTVHEQQMDIIAKNLPQILQVGPAWGQVLFEMSTIRNKPEIMEMVNKIMAQSQKPPEPNISFSAALDKIGGPEKGFIYAKLGAPPDLVQQILQASPPPTQVLDHQQKTESNAQDAQSEVIKTQQATKTEELKGQTEMIKAQAAIQKAQLDMQKAQMDMQLAERKAELDARAMDQKAAHAERQSEIDIMSAGMDMAGKASDQKHQQSMQKRELKAQSSEHQHAQVMQKQEIKAAKEKPKSGK